jgi:hypothetical protein
MSLCPANGCWISPADTSVRSTGKTDATRRDTVYIIEMIGESA